MSSTEMIQLETEDSPPSTDTIQPDSKPTEVTGLTKFFGNIKIRTKILTGFAAVLAILIAVSGISYSSFVFIGHEVDLLAEDVEQVALISHIEAEFLKLKGHARDFANKSHEADAERVEEIAHEIEPAMEEALERISDPAIHEKLVEMEEALEFYLKDFEEAKVLEYEFQNLIHGELEPNGVAIIEDLDEVLKEAAAEGNADAIIYAGAAREHALLAQLYVNILIGRQDDSFGVKAEHEFAEFAVALEALGGAARTEFERALHADLTERFHAYEGAFEKIHENEVELRHLVDGEMKEAAELIAEDAEWIEHEISMAEEIVRDEAIAAIETAEIEMVIAGLVGVVMGIVLAWLIGNGTARPIIGMSLSMRQLAEGDKTSDIPGRGRGDEIGEMAEAVQVFKENAIENERLEAEQAEMLRTEVEKFLTEVRAA